MKGYFMEPQNMSVNDGNGIRTLIFMAGCPLRCQWCSNPESQGSPANSRGRGSLVREYWLDEIMEIIERQRIFYRFSGGGVTFSGGEATMQLEILDEMSMLLYDKAIDMAIETCGYFDFQAVKRVMDRMSLIFIDLKLFNGQAHRKFTGMDNALILENIRKFGEMDYQIVIRIPLIEGVNTDQENISHTADFISKHIKKPKVELLPYHSFGDEKYRDLQLELPSREFKAPDKSSINEIRKIFKSKGIEVVKY
ncbi:MAG: glycyl-radical enzyme activating protein [Gudongella sp.]|nr:glycyl-radical enzyme activating protein [Gudongella sp.]